MGEEEIMKEILKVSVSPRKKDVGTLSGVVVGEYEVIQIIRTVKTHYLLFGYVVLLGHP